MSKTDRCWKNKSLVCVICFLGVINFSLFISCVLKKCLFQLNFLVYIWEYFTGYELEKMIFPILNKQYFAIVRTANK